MVNFKINGMEVSVPEGTTILSAAKQIGVEIPTLCFLKDINEIGACRICIVEVEGLDCLVAACNTAAEEGMSVLTDSPRVIQNRKMNLQLILSQHDKQCLSCARNENCKLQQLADEYGIFENIFPEKPPKKAWEKNAVIVRNESKCIKCMRCIATCDKIQNMNIWDVVNTGSRTTVAISQGRKLSESDCTLCGQCVTHCPVGALTVRDDIMIAQSMVDDFEVKTVVQVAPAVRAAWADGLEIDNEKASVGKMVAAIKRLGVDFVFDTNFAADLTIMEEGSEFLERFTHKENYKWPMFTSCCPGWVRFAKGQFPQFTENLSTAKSPQQMFGAVAKSYFAEKMGLDPHNIRVISIMPCSAKKGECALPNQKDACGDSDVDVVLTTRELQRWIKDNGMNLNSLPEAEFDSPLGEGTGAAVIFGATGGVMDAALRSAHFLATGKNPDADAFSDVRADGGIKEATFKIDGAGDVRVAVVSGLKNTRELMEKIDNGEVEYDFVEVMACPGGCAGGGGQPITDGEELFIERGARLWELDKSAKVRFSHENSEIKTLYSHFLEKPLSHKAHELLHTDHTEWQMPLNPKLK